MHGSILDPDLQSCASDPCVWAGPYPDKSAYILAPSYILDPAHSWTMACITKFLETQLRIFLVAVRLTQEESLLHTCAQYPLRAEEGLVHPANIHITQFSVPTC